jgi:hypothetical protein
LCWHKNQFYWMQIIFLSGTKCLWLSQYVNKFFVWQNKFGPAKNILEPVKGQGISSHCLDLDLNGNFHFRPQEMEIINHIYFS